MAHSESFLTEGLFSSHLTYCCSKEQGLVFMQLHQLPLIFYDFMRLSLRFLTARPELRCFLSSSRCLFWPSTRRCTLRTLFCDASSGSAIFCTAPLGPQNPDFICEDMQTHLESL